MTPEAKANDKRKLEPWNPNSPREGTETDCKDKCSPNELTSAPWVRCCSGFVPRSGKVIAYIRYTDDPWDAGRQLDMIQNYCGRNGYHLVKAFEDAGKPGNGLSRALEALREADALIAVDMDRFMEHDADYLRDLRPFIHDFFGMSGKHLITIKEGIDTSSPNGQLDVIDFMSERRNHGLKMT
jgi:hypothetical protein